MLSALAAFILLIFHESVTVLWIGTALFGFGMSAIFPTVFALAEEYIDVSGRISSALVIGSAFGEMILPLIIGNMTTKENPLAFVKIIFWLSAFTVLFSIGMIYTGKKSTKTLQKFT